MDLWVYALWFVLAGADSQPEVPQKAISVVIGESVAGIRLGMALADVRKLGFVLEPEGGERLIGRGWQTGPLLVIVDDKDHVALVSLDLRKSAGAKVDKTTISKTASLDEIAKLLSGCVLSPGSAGRELACENAAGRVTYFYDSYLAKDLWIIMR